MSRVKFFSILIMAIGAILAAKGLFAALVEVPLVGSIRYSEMHLGGKELAIAIASLLGLATILVGGGDKTCRVAWLFAGTGLGLAIASLLAIYRGTMDKLQELADATGGQDIQAMLAKTVVESGTYVLGAGLVLFTLGLIGTLFEKKVPRW